jgi:hypothetical protein
MEALRGSKSGAPNEAESGRIGFIQSARDLGVVVPADA